MVKWENDKNAYILGAALGALNATITNEICEGVIAGWRKSCVFSLFCFPHLYASPTSVVLVTFLFFLSVLLLFSNQLTTFARPSYSCFPSPSLAKYFTDEFEFKTATNTLGEAPTLRAVKDQIKKLSSSSTSATTKRANGVKKFRATAAKGKDKGKGKSKKRTRDDDNDSADEAKDGDEEQEQQGDGDEERSPTNAKKQKVVVKQEQVDGNEDEEV